MCNVVYNSIQYLYIMLIKCLLMQPKVYNYAYQLYNYCPDVQDGEMQAIVNPEACGSTIIRLEPMEAKLQVISFVLLHQKIYISGIAAEDVPKSRHVQVYSLNEGKWSTLPEAPNHNAPIAVIDGHITLIGGRDAETNKPSNSLSVWLEEERKWEKMQLSVPASRVASAVYQNDNLLLVSGGAEEITENKTFKVVNTVNVYNFTTKQWSTPEALQLPQALRSHHMVAFEGNIYLASGATTFPARV